MKTEKIKLEIRICPETQKPFVCDQDGRKVAAVTRYNIESPIASAASVTLTAHLHADGKKYSGRKASVRDLTPLERGEAIHKAMLDDAQESPSMKLVDILARELKVWPESWGIFCVATKVEGNDAAWFNFRNPVFKDGGWQDLGSVELWLSQEPEDRKEVVVRRFEWQAAVDALKVAEGIADAEAGNLASLDEVKNKWEIRRNARTLGGLIDLGYLQPFHLETPTYDFSAWPPERFDCGMLPSLYVQSFGRSKRHQPVEPKPKSTAQENTEFLEARVKLLEDEEQSRKARIKDLESQLEQLTADNEALSDIVVQLDDNAIQVLVRARDGDGLYFTSKEGQKVSVIRSGD